MITKIIAAEQAEGNGTLTQQQETDFWLAMATVSKSILPVTPESLRCSVSLGKHSAASLAAKRYRLLTIITLVALLLFQVYWVIGATILTDIEAIKGRLASLSSEFFVADNALKQLNYKDRNYATEKVRLQLQLDIVNDKVMVERIGIATDFTVLKNWNLTNSLLLWARTARSVDKSKMTPSTSEPSDNFTPIDQKSRFLWEFTPETVEQVQTAKISLTTLLKYILPILYGALGASTFIVRSLADQIKSTTYTTESDVGYRLRFYLGAVAGLSIAWFTSDPKGVETTGILQSLSPLALAFLAGFSVELLFSLLERVMAAFSVTDLKGVPRE
ncbi:MAG: hypothetical protein H7Y42_10790 [Chitinophagaceae bacterium]|nr:hypothetical protein [Chitinophagaceae bacterium]